MQIVSKSSLEPVAVSMPWRLSLFLLSVFAMANPFDWAQSGGRESVGLDRVVEQVESGNMLREVSLLFLGIFAVATFMSKRRNRLGVNGILGWSVIFFLGLALASPAWAEDPSLTIRRVGVFVMLFLGALATVARLSEVQTAALAACTCGITLIISLAVEIATGTFRPFDGTWRFSGMVHSVEQGWNCGLLAIAVLALAWHLPRSRRLFVFFGFVAFLFLFLTRSRMPLVSAVLAVAIYGSLVSAKLRRITFASAYVLLTAGCLICFVLFVMGEDLSGTAKSLAGMGRGEEATSTLGSFTGRLPLWNEELNFARARPILGYGYDAFLDSKNLAPISRSVGWVPTSPHSGYLGTLLGLGYVGAATLVLVLLLALKRSFSLSRSSPNAAFSAAIMVWLCCNLFLESTIITDPTLPTLLCLTVIASLAFKSSYAHRFVRLHRAY